MKKTKSTLQLLIILTILTLNSYSQHTENRVNYESIGISFVIPVGWLGQETQAGYMLKSTTMTGFVLINKNFTNDIDTLFYEAQQGFFNDSSNYIKLQGNVENFKTTGIRAEYYGVMEGISAKAYIVGLLNTTGLGISIMAATTSENYSSIYKQLCIDIANSVQKQQSEIVVKQTEHTQETGQTTVRNKTEKLFEGARLSYFDSGSGYGTKITIDLCEQGFFHHSSYDSVSADVGTVSVGSGGQNNGAGKWYIVEYENQLPVLQLKFYNGDLYAYYITLEDGKTYLDNRRYFREYGAERGAQCY